jgi:hypothetical protein
MALDGYHFLGGHSCEEKVALYKRDSYDLLILDLDKCYVSNRTYLGNSKLEVLSAVFFDPNTYLYLHPAFEYSHSLFSRLDPLLESDEGLFLLTKSGVQRHSFRARLTESLIEGPYKRFAATRLQIITKNLLLLAADSGEIMLFDQTQKKVVKIIPDFHAAPLVFAKSMLKSMDSLPLIYTACKDGNLLCLNVNDLDKPFIKFDLLSPRHQKTIRFMDIVECYKLIVIVTTNAICLYNVFAKSRFAEVSFSDLTADPNVEITTARLASSNLLEVELLLFDNKGATYVVSLMDLDFLRFNLESQTVSTKTTENAIELKKFYLSTEEGEPAHATSFAFGEGNFFVQLGRFFTKMHLRKKSKPYFSSSSFVTALPMKVVG